MIVTSYFGNYRNFGEYTPISIARYSPKHYNGLSILDFENFSNMVPSSKMLFDYKAKKIGNVEYAKLYIMQLQTMDFNKFIELFDNYVLLCYEKTGDFCHRNVFSFYARKVHNYEIKELGVN